MPHLVIPNFQLTIVAFPTRPTFVAQINEAWEVGEEMEIDSWRTMNEVGTWVEETLGSWPLSESQIDSSAREKNANVREVLMEKVKDSPSRSQLEVAPSGIVKPIIELPCDLVE